MVMEVVLVCRTEWFGASNSTGVMEDSVTDWKLTNVVLHHKMGLRDRNLAVWASKLKGLEGRERAVAGGQFVEVNGHSKRVNEREEVCGLRRGCSSDGRALA